MSNQVYNALTYNEIVLYTVSPSIVDPVNNITTALINESNSTEIICEAIGYPPPTVVWSRTNGDRVSVSDSVSVPTGYGNVTRVSVNLTITNASREDTGVYMCSANNSVGDDERIVNITVQCKCTCVPAYKILLGVLNPIISLLQSIQLFYQKSLT